MTGRFLKLERSDQAPAKAREWAAGLVAGFPHEARSDVVLLTHELVTNAVRHSDGDRIWLAAVVTPEMIRVEVSDEGGVTEPVMLPQQPYATSGRGLVWVDQLADGWGTEHERASSVWFQIDLPSRTLTTA
ncbi:MAG: ATP-binding protein [Actinomycetota bacterium]|nr:ATP-binding protein [Actinomycetota bacterium]